MAVKRRYLFLYLAIACIAGLAALFIVDAYLGVYDTIYVTVGEYEQKIEADFWQHQDTFWPQSATVDQKVSFRYEIENHQFSTYSTHIQASVWKENQKVLDLFSEDKSIEPFGKAMAEWTLTSQQLESAGFGIDVSADFTVKISYGNVERKLIVSFYRPQSPYEKPVPVPPVVVPEG